MPSQTRYPTAASGWSNPNNIFSEDGQYASSGQALSPGQESTGITCYGFGFSIPSNATITGIVVEVKAYASSGNIFVPVIYLNSAWRKEHSSRLQTSAAWFTFGSSVDTWGGSWDPSVINSYSWFYVVFAFKNATTVSQPTRTVYVDVLRVTVYYTEPIQNKFASESRAISLSQEGWGFWGVELGRAETVSLASGETVELAGEALAQDSSVLSLFETSGFPTLALDPPTISALEGAFLQVLASQTETGLLTGPEAALLSAQLSGAESPLLTGTEEDFVLLQSLLTVLLNSSEDLALYLPGSESQALSLSYLSALSLLGIETARIEEGIFLRILPFLRNAFVRLRLLPQRVSLIARSPAVSLSFLATPLLRRNGMQVFRRAITKFQAVFTSERGERYDPETVLVKVLPPSGTVQTLTPVRVGVGIYEAQVEFSQNGVWTVRVEGEGPLRAVVEERVEVTGDL